MSLTVGPTSTYTHGSSKDVVSQPYPPVQFPLLRSKTSPVLRPGVQRVGVGVEDFLVRGVLVCQLPERFLRCPRCRRILDVRRTENVNYKILKFPYITSLLKIFDKRQSVTEEKHKKNYSVKL